MVEQVKVIADASFPLDGILTLPDSDAESFPAVVFVHGSGPLDKDESIGATKLFRDLADGFAEKGIASLRYDKRTLIYGRQMVEKGAGNVTVESETIEDAIAAVSLVKSHPRIDPGRVFIAGHSMGGMLAPRIDAEGADLAGYVILAGTMRSLDEVIMDQNADAMERLPVDQQAAAIPLIKALKEKFDAIAGMSEEEAKRTVLSGSIYAWYLKEMKEHPIPEYLLKTDKPCFVLQGDKDVQVSAEKDFNQYQRILSGRENAKCKLYPGLNHLFMKAVYGNINQVLDEYKIPQTVDANVLIDISEWILTA